MPLAGTDVDGSDIQAGKESLGDIGRRDEIPAGLVLHPVESVGGDGAWDEVGDDRQSGEHEGPLIQKLILVPGTSQVRPEAQHPPRRLLSGSLAVRGEDRLLVRAGLDRSGMQAGPGQRSAYRSTGGAAQADQSVVAPEDIIRQEAGQNARGERSVASTTLAGDRDLAAWVPARFEGSRRNGC